MKNISKIFWSKEAINNLKLIVEYLESKWTEIKLRKFSIKLDKHIDIIKKNPEAFPVSDKTRKVRKAVLTRQTTVYYRIINDEVINIVSVFDNRWDPNKLKFE